MRDLTAVAETAALSAAAVISQNARRHRELRSKSASVDLVTEVDIAAGVAAVRSLLADDPNAAIVVEEPEVYEQAGTAEARIDEGRVWVIDPIDGTTSFVHGYPCFSVSVALLEDGQPIVGVVHNVPLVQTVTAKADSGVTCNGQPVYIGTARQVEDALLVTGFPYDRTEPFDRQLRLFSHFARIGRGVRRDGSAAIDLCHIALGRADAFWEIGLMPWDTAAGTLIVREAGGVVTDFDGNPWTTATREILAANPTLHAVMLDRIREIEA